MIRTTRTINNILPCPSLQAILSVSVMICLCGSSFAWAQVQTSIVADTTLPGGNNSIVLPNGSRVDITGGFSAGSNLFHSFSDFQVGSGDLASFQSQGADNILSRVSGSNPSNIFGTIGVDIGQADRTNANFFFLNPNGVVFGPTASLDLNGSFHVSTADSLRLGTGPGAGLFSPTDPNSDLLTSAPPSAFGFLAENPGSIAINQSKLIVSPNQSLIVAGGDVSIKGIETTDFSTILQAPGGVIGLVSVASNGEVPITPESLDLDSFATLGNIEITDEALIDTSGNGAGTVVIRGGNLVLDQVAILSNTPEARNSASREGAGISAPIGIDIELSEDFRAINNTFVITDHGDLADAGDIQIVAQSVTLTDSTIRSQNLSSDANSGSIRLKANEAMTLTNSDILVTESDIKTDGTISGIELTASTLFLADTSLRSETRTNQQAGNIILNVDQLSATSSTLNSFSTLTPAVNFGGTVQAGNAGNVVIQGKAGNGTAVRNGVELESFNILTSARETLGEGGSISIRTDGTLRLLDSFLGASVAKSIGPPNEGTGSITLTADKLILLGTTLNTETSGRRNAGNVILNVNELTTGDFTSFIGVVQRTNLTSAGVLPSRNTFEPDVQSGSAGRVIIQGKSGDGTPVANTIQLAETDISTTGSDLGAGGLISIKSNSALALEDTTLQANVTNGLDTTSEGTGNIELTAPTVLLQATELLAESRGTRNAGNVTLNVSTLQTNNSNISSSSLSGDSTAGKAGNVEIQGLAGPAGTITLDNATISTTVASSKPSITPANITITATDITLSNGTTINANTLGTAPAGDIVLKAAFIQANDATFSSTSSLSGPAGSISFEGPDSTLLNPTAVPGRIQLSSTRLSTTAEGTGTPGSISLAAIEGILLTDTTITADANNGSVTRPDNSSNAIEFFTPSSLQVTGGRISATTRGSRFAGDVVIRANEVTTQGGTQILGNSLGPTTTGGAGSISFEGPDSTLLNPTAVPGRIQLSSTRLSTTAEGTGTPGNISLGTQSSLTIDSSTISATANDVEGGGDASSLVADISLLGSTLDVKDTTIEAKSTGSRNAGAISLGDLKTQQLLVQDQSVITTEATEASGGDIKLTAEELVVINNSQFEASVEGNAGTTGGSINIDPEFVVIQNSELIARARLGTGGAIGIVGDVVLIDALSTFDVSSTNGVSGTVVVSSPIQNLSQAIAPLPEDLVKVSALYNAHCAGQKNGQFSSFSLKDLDRIPHVPGELLPTPPMKFDSNIAQLRQPQRSSPSMAHRLQIPGFGLESPLAFSSSILSFEQGCS